METMQLLDAVFRIGDLGDDVVICAKEPFTWGSDAVIAQLNADYSVPPELRAAGYAPFLDREDVLHNLEQISQKRASRKTQVELLCHYATTDAYPAWFNDLPDREAPA